MTVNYGSLPRIRCFYALNVLVIQFENDFPNSRRKWQNKANIKYTPGFSLSTTTVTNNWNIGKRDFVCAQDSTYLSTIDRLIASVSMSRLNVFCLFLFVSKNWDLVMDSFKKVIFNLIFIISHPDYKSNTS